MTTADDGRERRPAAPPYGGGGPRGPYLSPRGEGYSDLRGGFLLHTRGSKGAGVTERVMVGAIAGGPVDVRVNERT